MIEYYKNINFYNKTDKDLTNGYILPRFKSIQQLKDENCGPACALMVLNFFKEEVLPTEKEVAKIMHTNKNRGTYFRDLLNFFTINGYKTESSLDFKKDKNGNAFHTYWKFRDYVLKCLKKGWPVVVENVDYGGHYKVLIGYDCGKDKNNSLSDVLIFADPFDKIEGEHFTGYTIFSADKFFDMWFDDHCLEEDCRKQPFIVIKGK